MYNKNNEKYIQRADIYFSHLWGSGIYCWNQQSDIDPTDVSGQHTNPLFMDVNTDILYRARAVYWKQNCDEYKYAILNSPNIDSVIWPVDLVELNNDDVTKVYVEPDYGIHLTVDDMVKDTNMVLLFPNRDYAISKSVNSVIQNSIGKKINTSVNWKHENILNVAKKITKAIANLNKHGYLCMDFDFNRMYLTDDGSVIFDYSHLIIRDKEKYPDAPDYIMDPGEYLLDFAMPSVVSGRVIHPSKLVQNYSLTAMLFYLLVGKLAYDGPLMMGFPDTNEIEHMHKFDAYHKNPVFIFEPTDGSNHLGEFAADAKFIDAWDGLPEAVQSVFIKTLGRKHTLMENPDEVYTIEAEEWLKLLDTIK